MRAPSMVMGMKISELLKLLWSKKLLARVRKLSASVSSREEGWVTPNWCSSSRSPQRHESEVLARGQLQKGAGGGEQRGRLIEVAVKPAEDPV